MENEFDNTEEWLKRKLQDAEPVWSEAAWNDFENRRNKKRRGGLWFYFTFTILALGFGSPLLYNYFNTNDIAISEIKNPTPTVKENEIVKHGAIDKPAKKSSTENLGNTTKPLPIASKNSINQQTILYKTPTEVFTKPNITMDDVAAYDQPTQMIDVVANYNIPNTNSVTENPTTEKQNPQIDLPAIEPKIIKAPIVAADTTTKAIEPLKVDKPKDKNDKPSKPYIKKTYIALEYNASQIILANDIVVPSTNYINSSFSKNASMIYNNVGLLVGKVIHNKILLQTGVNIYSYYNRLSYTIQTAHTQLVAQPYTSFRMDTVMRRINIHTDTVYSAVKSIHNENHETKVQLQYISIPLNVLYQFKYKSAQIGVGGGVVIQHLQNTPASYDYNDVIKVSPWKMNANVQLDAGWKLYKSVSIYTGYNFGYGVSNKINYIQRGFKAGFRILL